MKGFVCGRLIGDFLPYNRETVSARILFATRFGRRMSLTEPRKRSQSRPVPVADDRLDHMDNLDIILHIRILNNHNITSEIVIRVRIAAPLPIFLVLQHNGSRFVLYRFQNLLGGIGRAIIDQNDFLILPGMERTCSELAKPSL